jgi:hypothetical protein
MTIVYIIPRVYMGTMISKHLNKIQISKIYKINQILRSKDNSFLCMCHDQKSAKFQKKHMVSHTNKLSQNIRREPVKLLRSMLFLMSLLSYYETKTENQSSGSL